MRMKKPKRTPWPSEAAMCASFQEEAKAQGFRVYPESGGHDMVLVAGAEAARAFHIDAGDQIAVEAKLHANLAVLEQAVPPWRHGYDGACADWYAVLAPDIADGFRSVAAALDILLWYWPPEETRRQGRYTFWEPRFPENMRAPAGKRLLLPLEVNMAAGMPSPRSVTPWKVAAVRLCLLGRKQLLLTSDFKHTPVRIRTFQDRGWIRCACREGRDTWWELIDTPTRPDVIYTEIVVALEAKLIE